jgi:CNT family concentrative nucleoside transporter
MIAFAGIAALLAIAWALSEDRPGIRLRTIVGGMALQLALAVLLLRVEPARVAMQYANHIADSLQTATDAGTGFVFGYLGGAPLPFVETQRGASFILAFKVLPLVLTISALSSLLIHWGVLQAIMRGFSALLRRSLGISGALALAAAVHVFVGMIEAPLLIRPWLARMTRGEIFAVMSCGMAGIAGTVMVIYAAILGPVIPDALGNILTAAIISTPAALAISAIMIPLGDPQPDESRLTLPHPPATWFDAILRGTADGVAPLVGIATMLIVAVALVALVNMALAFLPDIAGSPVTLERIAALPFRPLLWLIGIPWAETQVAGSLMGTKTILNEFVAYLKLAGLPPEALSPHSRLIMTYALCGFANLGSVGILVGGMSAMVPERRDEIATLGLRSLISGTLATCTSGAWAGLLSSGG